MELDQCFEVKLYQVVGLDQRFGVELYLDQCSVVLQGDPSLPNLKGGPSQSHIAIPHDRARYQSTQAKHIFQIYLLLMLQLGKCFTGFILALPHVGARLML